MTPKEEAVERLRYLLDLLPVYTKLLEIGEPGAQLELVIIAKREDGTGRIGPSWDLGPFVEDLKLLVGGLDEGEKAAIDALVGWRSSSTGYYGDGLLHLIHNYIYGENPVEKDLAET